MRDRNRCKIIWIFSTIILRTCTLIEYHKIRFLLMPTMAGTDISSPGGWFLRKKFDFSEPKAFSFDRKSKLLTFLSSFFINSERFVFENWFYGLSSLQRPPATVEVVVENLQPTIQNFYDRINSDGLETNHISALIFDHFVIELDLVRNRPLKMCACVNSGRIFH